MSSVVLNKMLFHVVCRKVQYHHIECLGWLKTCMLPDNQNSHSNEQTLFFVTKRRKDTLTFNCFYIPRSHFAPVFSLKLIILLRSPDFKLDYSFQTCDFSLQQCMFCYGWIFIFLCKVKLKVSRGRKQFSFPLDTIL